jgi:hypothetical protein
LLVSLALIVAIGTSWLMMAMRDQRKQRAAAEAVEKAGGRAFSRPTWLGVLLRDDSLVTVTCAGYPRGSATDAGLAHLGGLSRLQWLLISNAAKVSDAGLVHLEGMSQLEALFLDGDNRITDAGLVHLQRLTRLQILILNGTQVSDAGLAHLEGLTQLRWLDVRNTKVTHEGVEKLQRALPTCIIRDG